MSGRLVHFEIPFDDGDRARQFYSSLFGWNVMEMPDMNYTMVTTGPGDENGMPTEPGYIGGGMWKRDSPGDGPRVVIDVDDIDATLQRITEAGGSVAERKMPVGDMGFAAYFTDPEGNLMGLWETARPAG